MNTRQFVSTSVRVAAIALGLLGSGAALADGSSLDPWIGESYAYFNGTNLGDAWFARYREAHLRDTMIGGAKKDTAPRVEPKVMLATDGSKAALPSPFRDNTGGA